MLNKRKNEIEKKKKMLKKCKILMEMKAKNAEKIKT